MQNIFKVNFSCLAVQLGMEGQEDDNFIKRESRKYYNEISLRTLRLGNM